MSQWSLNTSRFSKNSLKLSVNGQTVRGLIKSAKETLSGDPMFLNGSLPVGKVVGELKGEFEFAFIPEAADTILQSVGAGFMEVPMFFSARLFEPGSPSVYRVSNGAIWLTENGLDLADTGALQTLKFTATDATLWNGVPGLDLASRADDPNSVGSLFASFGLALAL